MSNLPKFYFALREDLKDDKQFLPNRAEPKASGWDVRAAFLDKKSIVVKPFEYIKIPLGFRAMCPEGWWYKLVPRSSTFAKKSLHALYGTVDETYENELVFACQYIPYLDWREEKCWSAETAGWTEFKFNLDAVPSLEINFGDAIGQIIPVKRQEMDVVEISNEDYNNASAARDAVRKTGGFGSTG